MEDKFLSALPLGRTVTFSPRYDPTQLCPVPRSLARKTLGIGEKSLPFSGEDIWNCWELSWLDPAGKPEVAVAEFRIPATSPFLVESKSLKLYLNSFNMTPVSGIAELRERLIHDVGSIVQAPVGLRIFLPHEFSKLMPREPEGQCIDTLPLNAAKAPVPEVKSPDTITSERLFSRLLRSHCPVTGQPDWATLHISYTGQPICHESLLRYIVSMREHTGFHESCAEALFCRILDTCNPEQLSVHARFTRRGGIDINPFRSTHEEALPNHRDFRQ
ncbi:NADPH-dependent 7-cyano-7-deazaguanine reductase QueF [Desulfobotulus sp. H1]|uniref:NADPH-dependent 7-cyano-7-deazaguanine reductase QueF n=1 Tax=Desulfobotulus pelophilus TaxID=2823377 RepID=A0ABT3N7S5_9BACT|nr:NADPH-dependent 7-cyano-7-deazaguanine reductase QueF [Desulfobotulus pelophilus]MCW7753506.1 NADPH-dependent 7-cyano-7-deazaguanine reductase QueF [Desulfobotulus pelophilus]